MPKSIWLFGMGKWVIWNMLHGRRTSWWFYLCCFISWFSFVAFQVMESSGPRADQEHTLCSSSSVSFSVFQWSFLPDFCSIPREQFHLMVCTFTQGSFHPCQNAGSPFGAGFRGQCPWKNQVFQYGKAGPVSHCYSVALFCPSTIWLCRQLFWGRKTSVSHFQKQQAQTLSFTELLLDKEYS